MTVKELIEKLKKLNPDGNITVGTHNLDDEEGFFGTVTHVTLEEDYTGDDLFVVLNYE